MKQRSLTPGVGIPMPTFDLSTAPSAPAAAPECDERMIDVTLIDPNPFAPRAVYTSAMIEARADALRQQGQHDPIHIIPNPDRSGRYMIADGWTRVRACIDHQIFFVLRAIVHHNLTPEAAAWFGYQQNEERQQHCDLDRAQFYEKLIATGLTAAEVARRAKIAPAQITFYRAYARLPEEIMQLVRENPAKFGSLAAYHLATLHDKVGLNKSRAVAAQFVRQDKPVRWLADQVKSLLEPPECKPVKLGRKIVYRNGSYWRLGEEFTLTMRVAADKREAFAQGLEALIATVAETDDGV